jgi:hypothetical protein
MRLDVESGTKSIIQETERAMALESSRAEVFGGGVVGEDKHGRVLERGTVSGSHDESSRFVAASPSRWPRGKTKAYTINSAELATTSTTVAYRTLLVERLQAD